VNVRTPFSTAINVPPVCGTVLLARTDTDKLIHFLNFSMALLSGPRWKKSWELSVLFVLDVQREALRRGNFNNCDRNLSLSLIRLPSSSASLAPPTIRRRDSVRETFLFLDYVPSHSFPSCFCARATRAHRKRSVLQIEYSASLHRDIIICLSTESRCWRYVDCYRVSQVILHFTDLVNLLCLQLI